MVKHTIITVFIISLSICLFSQIPIFNETTNESIKNNHSWMNDSIINFYHTWKSPKNLCNNNRTYEFAQIICNHISNDSIHFCLDEIIFLLGLPNTFIIGNYEDIQISYFITRNCDNTNPEWQSKYIQGYYFNEILDFQFTTGGKLINCTISM